MSEKALGPGSEEPPIQEGKMRLYSMRFCPFAERVLLVLEAKQAQYDVFNINLAEKPEWFVKRFPSAKVPAIIFSEDRWMIESVIICDYLDDAYKVTPLHSICPYQRAWGRVHIEMMSEVAGLFVKLLKDPSTLDDQMKALSLVLNKFEEVLTRSNKPYFRGDDAGMVDYMLWPLFKRFRAFPHMAKLDQKRFGNLGDPTLAFPQLKAWLGRMAVDASCKKFDVSHDTMAKYLISYADGKPDYDLGL